MSNPHEKVEPKNLSREISDLNEAEREERVRALRTMLAVTEARQKKIKRARNQTLSAGLSVKIINGDNRGEKGVLLDADYIHSKVLVRILDCSTEVWVGFADVSPLTHSDKNTNRSQESD